MAEPTDEQIDAAVNVWFDTEPGYVDSKQGFRIRLRAALAAISTSPAAVDVEQLLRDTVPGGSSCDPQQIADAIRAWFADRSSPAAREAVQSREEFRQALGEVLSQVLTGMCDEAAPDWCDSRHVDEVLDEIMPVIRVHFDPDFEKAQWMAEPVRQDSEELSDLRRRLLALARKEDSLNWADRIVIGRAIEALATPPLPQAPVDEAVARAIYEQWVDRPGFVPWVAGGNSDMQYKARDIARAALSRQHNEGERA